MSSPFRALEALEIALDSNVPVILWGMDGEGKSAAARAIAEARGWVFAVINGANLDPTDIGGIPFINADGVGSRVPMALAIREAVRCSREGEHMLFFIDELTSSPQSVLASLLTTLSEWVAGDEQLSREYIHFVAAANPPHVAVSGVDLQPPTCTRMIHLQWELPYEYWAEGVQTKGWVPAGQATQMEIVCAFLEHNCAMGSHNEHKFRVPPSREGKNASRPTPRTWTNLSRVLHAADARGVSSGALRLVVEGTIGAGMGKEFMEFRKLRDLLPNMAEALASPETTEIPTRGDISYLFFRSLGAYVANTLSVKDWKAAWVIIARTEDTANFDMAALGARRLAKLMGTPEGKVFRKHIPKEASMFAAMFRDLGKLGTA